MFYQRKSSTKSNAAKINSMWWWYLGHEIEGDCCMWSSLTSDFYSAGVDLCIFHPSLRLFSIRYNTEGTYYYPDLKEKIGKVWKISVLVLDSWIVQLRFSNEKDMLWQCICLRSHRGTSNLFNLTRLEMQTPFRLHKI